MAGIQRKVSFYRLSLEKKEKTNDGRTFRYITLTNTQMEEQFDYIYQNKMSEISNGGKAIKVDTTSSKSVVEVINYSSHRVS